MRDFVPQPKSSSDAYVRTEVRPDVGVRSTEIRAAKCPTEFNGQKIQPLEGRSLVLAFADKPIERDAIFWEHEGKPLFVSAIGSSSPSAATDLGSCTTSKPIAPSNTTLPLNTPTERTNSPPGGTQVKPYPEQIDGKTGDGKKKNA